LIGAWSFVWQGLTPKSPMATGLLPYHCFGVPESVT